MQEDIGHALAKLREPFEPHQISLLPKPYKRDSEKGKCSECGGFHGLPAVHLKYVGHAALTDRLLEVDPSWTWDFLAVGPDGYPVIDKDGGMWIKLTVCGISRYGYGDAQGKSGGDAMKERIGDALRNAAMRFGAALDLWHKGDLHGVDEDDPKPSKVPASPLPPPPAPTSEKPGTGDRVQVLLTTVEKKEAQDHSWTCWTLKAGNEKWGTFSKTIGALAEEALALKKMVELTYTVKEFKKGKFSHNIETLEIIDDVPL